MSATLTALAYYERLYSFIEYYLEKGKTLARQYLGPQPQNYYLLPDGRVLPATQQLPHALEETAYLFDCETRRITLAHPGAREPEGRFRQLPILAANIEHPLVGNVDISDWLGDIRANPIPDLHAKQLFQLWSLDQNTFVMLSDGAVATLTRNDGEIEVHTY